MLKALCSHCQGTEQGTSENPRFSIREHYLYGFPVVEILKNGGPVHNFDSNFRFGVRKAQMLLACTHVLREFWRSSDEEKLTFGSQVVEDQRRRISVRIQIEMHPDFNYSTGQTVERPWLRLQSLPPDTEHIGLGSIKCRAICEVKIDLEQWLRKHGIPT
jgi:hypothetical protein